MREAADTYLPAHAYEDDDHYTDRLNSSVLYNGFEEAVDGVVSRVFAEPVIVKDDAVEMFKKHAEDMTGLGENLDGFARRVFLTRPARCAGLRNNRFDRVGGPARRHYIRRMRMW